MRKKHLRLLTVSSFLVLFMVFISVKAYADEQKRLGFGFGVNYYLGSDSRFTGNGNLFLLTFRLSDEFTVSFLREEFKLDGAGRSDKGIKKNVDVDCSITGMRILRRITNLLSIGIDIGNADFSNGISDDTIMGGVIVTFTTLESKGELFNSQLNMDLGYKILNINNTDTFDNPSKLVEDLSSFFIGLNLKILF